MGRSFGASEASFAAVRSPPLQERRSKVRWPRWGNPEMTRKAVFSEGRTLCVRVARPYASRGIPFPPDHEARGRLAYRAHASVKRKPTLRPCGARPSARWPSDGEKALRGQTRRCAKGGFLGGTRSARPSGTAVRMPGHFIPTPCVGERPVAYRGHVSVKPGPSLRACGPRPSAARPTPTRLG